VRARLKSSITLWLAVVLLQGVLNLVSSEEWFCASMVEYEMLLCWTGAAGGRTTGCANAPLSGQYRTPKSAVPSLPLANSCAVA